MVLLLQLLNHPFLVTAEDSGQQIVGSGSLASILVHHQSNDLEELLTVPLHHVLRVNERAVSKASPVRTVLLELAQSDQLVGSDS